MHKQAQGNEGYHVLGYGMTPVTDSLKTPTPSATQVYLKYKSSGATFHTHRANAPSCPRRFTAAACRVQPTTLAILVDASYLSRNERVEEDSMETKSVLRSSATATLEDHTQADRDRSKGRQCLNERALLYSTRFDRNCLPVYRYEPEQFFVVVSRFHEAVLFVPEHMFLS